MSQVAPKRKGSSTPSNEIEKAHSEGPVKDMKKKMVATVSLEKDKAIDKIIEKNGDGKSSEKNKPADNKVKPAENKAQPAEHKIKPAENKAHAAEHKDKPAENKVKPAENKVKPAENKVKPAENKDKPVDNKPKSPENKDTKEKKDKVAENNEVADKNGESSKDRNGKIEEKPKQNGSQNGHQPMNNGVDNSSPVTVSDDDDDDELRLVMEVEDQDVGVDVVERSVTRRDQSKEKVPKLKEDAPADRKMTPKKNPDRAQEAPKANGNKTAEPINVEVVVEQVEVQECDSRKPDTNFSRSRVKISPYRRSMRLADQTNSSTMANYTGNNTTMEMDITESSSYIEEASPGVASDSIRSLRSIRGRTSYKQLKELNLSTLSSRAKRDLNVSSASTDTNTRPTAPVVGRKRRADITETEPHRESNLQLSYKRPRLLDRLYTFVGRGQANAPIVGINTDLPLTAPIAAAADPETIKSTIPVEPIVVATEATESFTDKTEKRCVIM